MAAQSGNIATFTWNAIPIGDLASISSAHSALTGDFLARNSRTFAIDFGDGNVSGTALLTNVSLSASIDDAARISISAQVVGALAIVP
jgi:hypothetical protein